LSKKVAFISGFILFALTLCAFSPFTIIAKGAGENLSQLQLSEIETFIEEQITDQEIPGLSLVITKGDKIVYLQGFGVTSLANPLPVTGNTVFDLASATKSFTAMGVLLLESDGLINLDSPLKFYIPDFELADREASKQITIRQLLNHTSGIPGTFAEPLAFHDGEDAFRELITGLDKVKLNREPGSSFEYSNINYCLLGALVENVTGLTFEDYMKQRLFTPLGMTGTTLDQNEASEMERADGHQPLFGGVVTRNIPIYRSAKPAGWVMSSGTDMGRWLLLFLNNGVLNGKKIIPEGLIKEATTPGTYFKREGQNIGYGMGWFVNYSENGTRVIWHGGDTPNFATEMILIPEHELGLAMMVNSQNSPIVHDMAAVVAGMILDSEFNLPTSPWWASWKAIDNIATWVMLFSFGLIICLVIYIWQRIKQLRSSRQHNGHSNNKGWFLSIWRVIPPMAMLLILGASVATAFYIFRNIFGYDIFHVITAFSLYSPPSVWLAAAATLGTICLWLISMLIMESLVARKNA